MKRNKPNSSPKPKRRNSPAPRPQSPPPPPGERKQRGVFVESAAMAGGISTGAVVGRTLGEGAVNILTGHNNTSADQSKKTEKNVDPCARTIHEFLNCTLNSVDIESCTELNEAVRQCKRTYDVQI
ncbi:Hypothetical protein CINCED_3A019282 [Cinara cedri]|uniref:Uncharacterized protein n=1 Tax=Cinara cedri TaxID=506608 RepID=A0A5E4MYF5_9HEMI|nr:Hypothetical protein CINCED_3A019282 [Cinara cedri]